MSMDMSEKDKQILDNSAEQNYESGRIPNLREIAEQEGMSNNSVDVAGEDPQATEEAINQKAQQMTQGERDRIINQKIHGIEPDRKGNWDALPSKYDDDNKSGGGVPGVTMRKGGGRVARMGNREQNRSDGY